MAGIPRAAAASQRHCDGGEVFSRAGGGADAGGGGVWRSGGNHHGDFGGGNPLWQGAGGIFGRRGAGDFGLWLSAPGAGIPAAVGDFYAVCAGESAGCSVAEGVVCGRVWRAAVFAGKRAKIRGRPRRQRGGGLVFAVGRDWQRGEFFARARLAAGRADCLSGARVGRSGGAFARGGGGGIQAHNDPRAAGGGGRGDCGGFSAAGGAVSFGGSGKPAGH